LRNRSRTTVITLLALACLLVSACGARLDHQQYAEARGVAGGNGQAGAGRNSEAIDTGGRGSVDTGSATLASGGAGEATQTGGGAGGAAPGASGPTGGPRGATSGGGGSGQCVMQHADSPGVSDTEVKFGNVSTISGPIPNFGSTGRAGAKAYFDYINSQGGVCGRKLTLVNADDRLDPGVNRSATAQLKDQVFGFVGDTTVEDDGGASVIGGTNVPNCSLNVGNLSITEPNYFSPNPVSPDGATNGTVAIFQWFKAHKGLTKVGIVYPDNPSASARIRGYVDDIKAAGLQVGQPIKVAVTESNYVGVAQQMQSEGDDGFITVLEINGAAKFAQAIQQIGWKPKVPFFGAQAYSPLLPKLAGPAANGTLLGITHDIVEGGGPAVTTMAKYYRASSSGQALDFFAIMGWTAAEMCVDALRAAGGAPTRDKAMTYLKGLHNFTASGLLAPRDPAGKKPPSQFAIVTVNDGKWQRVYPSQGFASS
jgi:ABC-type branched-subunit amino acid transport system substrate-binding protein